MNKLDMSKAGSIFGNGIPPDNPDESAQEESTTAEAAGTATEETEEKEIYQAYGVGELGDGYENAYDDDDEPSLSNEEFYSQLESNGVDTGRNRPAPEMQQEETPAEDLPEESKVFPDKESAKYAAVKSEEQIKAEEERRSVVINGIRFFLHMLGKEQPNAEPETDMPEMTLAGTKVRTYKGLVKRPKTKYATPKNANGNPVKKIVMFLLVCVAVGIGAGVLGNSYAVSVGDDSISSMSALWNGLMGLESGMQIVTSPIYGSIFGMDFLIGFGILALIGVFIYLDKEQKKLSRVGHEHGNARLGKNSDFKSFKKKFMD